MEKKLIVYGLLLLLGTGFYARGQIRIDSDKMIEKGVQESFLLKKAGRVSDYEVVVISNSKNKLRDQPMVKPPGTYAPGYDDASIIYRMDRDAIRKLIAPIILSKAGNENEGLIMDFYFTPEGTMKEVVFITNDRTRLSLEDFEKMERLLLANIRISPKRSDFNPFKGVPFVVLSEALDFSDLRKP